MVVHHDNTLERTTSGRGSLADRTADELAAIDAGHWFRAGDASGLPQWASGSVSAGEFPFRARGIGIPTLREVLRRYPEACLIIELKVNDPDLAVRTVDDVRDAGAIERVAFGSFWWRVLHTARTYEPRIRTGAAREETRWALYRSWVHWPLRRPRYHEFQVPERSGATTIVTPQFIAHAHRAGLPVKVWTVNDPVDMRRLLDWDVDALITDRPDLAVDIVRARR